jgi:hypothetical protein
VVSKKEKWDINGRRVEKDKKKKVLALSKSVVIKQV